MNQTQLHFARHQLHTQVSNLDQKITMLCQWINSDKLIKGSIIIEGRTDTYKPFYDLLTWNQAFPLPIEHIKKFAEQYVQDLIAKRNYLLIDIDKLEKSPIEKEEEGHE